MTPGGRTRPRSRTRDGALPQGAAQSGVVVGTKSYDTGRVANPSGTEKGPSTHPARPRRELLQTQILQHQEARTDRAASMRDFCYGAYKANTAVEFATRPTRRSGSRIGPTVFPPPEPNHISALGAETRRCALIKEVGFARDSPLEGDGFELPVPRELGLRRGRRLALHLGSLTLRRRGPDWNATKRRRDSERRASTAAE